MKRAINAFLALLIAGTFAACNYSGDENQQNQESAVETVHDGHHANAVRPTSSTGNFGEKITADDALAATELPALLEGKESITVKLTGDVESVCQMTGCWMDIDIGNDETVHVTFKDDGFLMPMDATGKKAVIEGVATYEEISVEMLKHLAEDEGKSEEEINAITEPRMEYTLVAKGVILEEI
ncbi:MAG: DUF4920 domain-containing protein [bacterium]